MLFGKIQNFTYFISRKFFYMISFFFMLFLFAACSSNTTDIPGNDIEVTNPPLEKDDAPEAVSPSPNSPSATPTPSVPQTADGFSAETAADLVREILPESSYDVLLLSDTLTVGNDKYYTFLVSQKGAAIEPLIIANQKTGELKCISSDNIVSDISTHPLYQKSVVESIRWEGTYIVERSDGTLSKYITLAPLDHSRFEFTAYNYLETGVFDLSGIAAIHGEQASFTSAAGTALTFSWEDGCLVIREQSASLEEGLAGIYSYAKDADNAISQISMEEALQKLKSIPSKRTGLAGDAENYYFYVQDKAVIVSDHLCYSILVYSEADNRLFYTSQFYVTVDGRSVYGTESPAPDSDDIKIFSIQ